MSMGANVYGCNLYVGAIVHGFKCPWVQKYAGAIDLGANVRGFKDNGTAIKISFKKNTKNCDYYVPKCASFVMTNLKIVWRCAMSHSNR